MIDLYLPLFYIGNITLHKVCVYLKFNILVFQMNWDKHGVKIDES